MLGWFKMDFILLLILFILTMGMTYLAFRSQFRFIISLAAGAVWICLGYLVLPLSLIFCLCCTGMGFYMWIRIFIQ